MCMYAWTHVNFIYTIKCLNIKDKNNTYTKQPLPLKLKYHNMFENSSFVSEGTDSKF